MLLNYCFRIVVVCIFSVLYMYLGEHLYRLDLLCNPFPYEIKLFQLNYFHSKEKFPNNVQVPIDACNYNGSDTVIIHFVSSLSKLPCQ